MVKNNTITVHFKSHLTGMPKPPVIVLFQFAYTILINLENNHEEGCCSLFCDPLFIF